MYQDFANVQNKDRMLTHVNLTQFAIMTYNLHLMNRHIPKVQQPRDY